MRTVTIDKPRPHVSVVSLNRPERLNAMSIELCLDRKSALEQVAVDEHHGGGATQASSSRTRSDGRAMMARPPRRTTGRSISSG